MTKPDFPTEVYGRYQLDAIGNEIQQSWYHVVFDSNKPLTTHTTLCAVYKLDRIVNMRGEVVEEPAK